MKHYAPALFATLFLFSSCDKLKKKTPGPPKVQIDAAVRQPDGTVKISVTYSSDDDAPVLLATFCTDTLPALDTNANRQVAADFNILPFSYTWPATAFKERKTYYFKATASSKYGTGVSEMKSIDFPGLDTSIIPCHVNLFKYQEQPGNKNEVYNRSEPLARNFQEWNMSAYTGSRSIDLEFEVYPHSGVYKIVNDDIGIGDNRVYVLINKTTVDTGQYLYVQRIDSVTMDVTLCGITAWLPNSLGIYQNATVTTKFRSPM